MTVENPDITQILEGIITQKDGKFYVGSFLTIAIPHLNVPGVSEK